MKILILGDSLTFSHNVKIEDTWPYLLQSNGHWVTHRGRGGATINKILYELTEIGDWDKDTQDNKLCPFDLCIVQVGIVDVTPRPINKSVTYFIRHVPLIKSALFKLSRSKNFLKYFGKPWTSETVFLKKFNLLREKINNFAKKTIFIEIARPAHYLKENCGDFSEKVKKYNKILDNNNERSTFLPVYDGKPSDEYLLRDGYHLNKLGHELIYRNILKKI